MTFGRCWCIYKYMNRINNKELNKKEFRNEYGYIENFGYIEGNEDYFIVNLDFYKNDNSAFKIIVGKVEEVPDGIYHFYKIRVTSGIYYDIKTENQFEFEIIDEKVKIDEEIFIEFNPLGEVSFYTLY